MNLFKKKITQRMITMNSVFIIELYVPFNGFYNYTDYYNHADYNFFSSVSWTFSTINVCKN